MVAYVLLIAIAISLSFIVYIWLKEILPVESEKCPDEASLIISSYECKATDLIDITFQNKGKFNIDGFLIKVSKEVGETPSYPLQEKQSVIKGEVQIMLKPGESKTYTFDYAEYGRIEKIQIQPFRLEKEKPILCQAVIDEKVSNCE